MSLDARLDVDVGEAVEFVLIVTNSTTERVELVFADGQTADVRVIEGGETVWRWGDGRMFTMARRTEALTPGEEARETMIWEDPVPGSYRAVATLEADASVSATNEFEVVD